MRLDINQDSGPADGNYLYGDLTKDSGVGRSPRTPGPGSDPRSLSESSVPPAWLQDVRERSFFFFYQPLIYLIPVRQLDLTSIRRFENRREILSDWR